MKYIGMPMTGSLQVAGQIKKLSNRNSTGGTGQTNGRFFWYAGLRNVGKAAFFNQHRLVQTNQ